ncbi:MAG: hypothetical protein ACI959_001340, partial [Limisphaerales bacterium]
DLDGDGDADVLSASINDNKIAWYENTGGGYCQTTTAPQNPESSVGVSTVVLNWTAVSQSVACEIQGHRLSPSGPNPKSRLVGYEVSGTTVPFSFLGAGTTWSWEVRCACQISPTVEATGFSATDTFTIPAFRFAGEDLDITPNPAQNAASITWTGRASDLLVTDLMGRVIYERRDLDLYNLHIETSSWSPGIYFVTLHTEDGSRSRQLVVE